MKIPFTDRYLTKSDAIAIAVVLLMLFLCTADSWFQ
jgi:hypothetical protein